MAQPMTLGLIPKNSLTLTPTLNLTPALTLA